MIYSASVGSHMAVSAKMHGTQNIKTKADINVAI